MTDPKTLLIAVLIGVIPALIWLWFWLREDKENPEPKGLILLTFILGMISVILVLPLEKVASIYITGGKISLVLALSFMEEVIKYLAAAVLALKSKFNDEPIDPAIYMITAALGFAAFENILFLIQPISLQETTVSLLTGNLRFLGATLLHATSSAFVGVALGLAFFKKAAVKGLYLLGGLIFAIALHTAFNFYIIRDGGENFLRIFAFLWVVTIIIILILEKLRRMGASTAFKQIQGQV
ncbi:hypothetical protein A3A09_00255 [Candidatus Nomurabacteria bacterium RIFCSPLOWO2_01_FULL_42_20]|nr:MAG: hypothetical protein A3A09_00255 [Candidatus Nomurabacteria bacterium RIFCSPLOWO2_01_FULL_42_20]